MAALASVHTALEGQVCDMQAELRATDLHVEQLNRQVEENVEEIRRRVDVEEIAAACSQVEG